MNITPADMIGDMKDTIFRAIKERDADTLHTVANALAEKDDMENAFFLRKTANKIEQMNWKLESKQHGLG